MIEIKCLDCKNCTGDSCKVYGSDADKAVKRCADDSFKNYKVRMLKRVSHYQNHIRRVWKNDCRNQQRL